MHNSMSLIHNAEHRGVEMKLVGDSFVRDLLQRTPGP